MIWPLEVPFFWSQRWPLLAKGGREVGEGLTQQNCKGQSGEGAIFVAALVATILNKVQDIRVTLLHSSQD